MDNVRLRVCSPEEIKTLLERAPADLALLARLTLESLLRLSEALSLSRDDISETFAAIVQSKSGLSRRVPLAPELRMDLLARCHTLGYVFGIGKDGHSGENGGVTIRLAEQQ